MALSLNHADFQACIGSWYKDHDTTLLSQYKSKGELNINIWLSSDENKEVLKLNSFFEFENVHYCFVLDYKLI